MTQSTLKRIRRRVKTHTDIAYLGDDPLKVNASEKRLVDFIIQLCDDHHKAGRIEGIWRS